jgi:3-methylcrotonyl-CoA carboxylase alpha subunit
MKMEHQIAAPRDGTVKEVHVTQGQQVTNGALLVVLEDDDV